jgi:putative ABC transport system substrate-binding protein
MSDIRRREFISLLGGATVAWPLAARAQEATSTIRRVGFLLPGVARTTAVRGLLEAFREGLKEYGWVEGQNISIDYRFADGKEDALIPASPVAAREAPAIDSFSAPFYRGRTSDLRR